MALTLRGQAAVAENALSAAEQRQAAIAFEQEGKNAEAETAWRKVLQSRPGNAEANAHLGFLESRQEHYRTAIALYRKALAANPQMPGLRMNLGLALFKAGELNEAIKIFEALRQQQPRSSPETLRLNTLIGMSHYGLKQYAAAVPYLKQATAADPQSLPFRLLLAHSCLWSKQYQCVLDVYREILALNAESAEADMLAGEALDEMQDHAGATEQFRAAVKANPKEPNVHFGLGYLLWTQGKYEEAAREFQNELDNVPNHAQALVYLADANLKMSHPETALPLLEKAISVSPQMELPHLDLGILHADAGRNDDAIRELKLATTLAPNDVKAHYRLARVYQTMGRKEEAKVEFDKTQSLTKAGDDSLLKQLNKTQAGNPATKRESRQ
ncbi:MAG TPA: tetratricopeptide repeat protein [Terriglobales bacterium]|nr:tetratricopeptide repeat protein [Terriglobales bacterium]